MKMPLLEVGQPVLVATAPDEPSWPMVVGLVQDGHITLAAREDAELPGDWDDVRDVHVTCLGRFSMYVLHVPVVRSGSTRLVIGEPADESAVQRRAYARVLSHVPVGCAVFDAPSAQWLPFEAEVRDLGGGGCSVLADVTPTSGATVV